MSRSAGWSIANPGNRAAREQLLDALLVASEAQLSGQGDLLDCGCGTGWLLEALIAAGVDAGRLYGVDRAPRRVEAAKRRAPGSLVSVADAAALPFPDSSFELIFQIVSLSSMGGAESVQAALVEARRVIAPGGLLLVYEPRIPTPFNGRTRLLRRGDLEAAGLAISAVAPLTLLPPVGRRLGRFTPALYPLLSAFRPLRSHRLLVASP